MRRLDDPKTNVCGDITGRAVEGASPYQSKIIKMSQQVKLPFISVGVDALGDPKTNACGDDTTTTKLPHYVGRGGACSSRLRDDIVNVCFFRTVETPVPTILKEECVNLSPVTSLHSFIFGRSKHTTLCSATTLLRKCCPSPTANPFG